jgi:hypothetical protein
MAIFDGFIKALDKISSPLSDEKAYEIVADELSHNKIEQGLWTKALADCDFDENRAKAVYVKSRVAALHQSAAADLANKRA